MTDAELSENAMQTDFAAEPPAEPVLPELPELPEPELEHPETAPATKPPATSAMMILCIAVCSPLDDLRA
ncbi:MAG: hypothetical protein ACRDRJ_05470 [Streptosporangiaceae bacterium]